MHLRSAKMLSQRQQTGVQQTIKSPSWSVSLDCTTAAKAELQDTELAGISQRV